MARRVFYSFHYQNDIFRVNQIRNRWVTYGNQIQSGVIDHAEFEKIKRLGEESIKKWIDKQLEGTSATVVLIGSETLNRRFVKYEICQSLKRGNAIIGVYINNLADMNNRFSTPCNIHTIVGYYSYGQPVYFDKIVNGVYDYKKDNGYYNLDKWVEKAVLSNRKEVCK